MCINVISYKKEILVFKTSPIYKRHVILFIVLAMKSKNHTRLGANLDSLYTRGELEKNIGDYEVTDPIIVEIAQRILATPDDFGLDLKFPNSHPDAQWFPKAGLGIFMHWGIHSVVGAQPSWAMIKDYPYAGKPKLYPPEKYFALADSFNPKKYDPEKWLNIAKQAGFQYAVITSKHHDGYALWPSKFGGFNSGIYLEGRDLLKPYIEACRKLGLKVGLYFSPRDWHFPNFPIDDVDFNYNKRFKHYPIDPQINQQRFIQFFTFVIAQIHELLTEYGKIDILWFDGMGWNDITDQHTKAVYAWIRSLQPGIVINDRWAKVSNPDDPSKEMDIGDFGTLECVKPTERASRWWEVCNIWDRGGGWGYDRKERVQSLDWFLTELIHSRSLGGNYLPNLGPRPDGEMTKGFYKRCKEIQAWMEKNGESVIGTTPIAPLGIESNVPITNGDHAWYLHIAPSFNRKKKIFFRFEKRIIKVTNLGSGTPINFSQEASTYLFEAPKGRAREVIKVEISEK